MTACGQTQQPKTYDKLLDDLLDKSVPFISQKDFKAAKDVILLDTRSRDEYEVSSIKGARWVGYRDFQMSKLEGVAKDSLLVVYCSVGYRSERIGEKLQKAGYTRVFNLYGSIFHWINEGNPVYRPDGTPTDQIHPYSAEWGRWLKRGNQVIKPDKPKENVKKD